MAQEAVIWAVWITIQVDPGICYYLHQVNVVNGGDNVFTQILSVALSVCVCVRVCVCVAS